MTDPAGGAPSPAPTPTPTPPPSQGNWQAPPPTPAPGGFNPNMQQVAAEPGPAPGIAYADLVTRIIALVIDGVILFVPYMVIAVILAFIGSIGSLIAALLFAAGSAGYFIYTWTKMRATYGQKFMKLETVSAADGATLTQDQAIRRWAFLFGPNALVAIVANFPIFFIAMLGSLLGLVAFGYALYLAYTTSQSPKRQGFHDKQAGTVVVKHL